MTKLKQLECELNELLDTIRQCDDSDFDSLCGKLRARLDAHQDALNSAGATHALAHTKERNAGCAGSIATEPA